MVAESGRYYGSPFKDYLGVTQGDPLSTTIFSVLVNAVICNWVTLYVGGEAVHEGFRRAVQWLAALLYADDGLLDLP